MVRFSESPILLFLYENTARYHLDKSEISDEKALLGTPNVILEKFCVSTFTLVIYPALSDHLNVNTKSKSNPRKNSIDVRTTSRR